jgi:ADP-ribose pyrophosphatase
MLPKTIRSERRYSGRVIDLIVDEIEYPSGNRAIREVVHCSGGAVVVPLLDDGRVILVRQHRYPFRDYVVELPAGKRDGDEDPLVCAKRELEEETGYRAASFEKLTAIQTTPGFCDEVLHVFLAQGLRRTETGQRLEEAEQSLTLLVMPLEEAVARVERGEITDGKTVCGLLLADRRMNTPMRA